MSNQSSPTYRWYVVGILTLSYLVSFLDRQILALMVGPIKADLQLSDTEISLIMGVAFSLFYAFMGIPLGWLADRTNRRNIIIVGIIFWSLMTAACGLASKFIHLFLARIGVGAGEASLTPSAISIISDYFSRQDRGRAIATYNMGVSLGTGIAMVLGGVVISFVADSPYIELPIIGTLSTWQYIFFVVSIPGLLVAIVIFFTISEPIRTETLTTHETQFSIVFVFKYMQKNFDVYFPIYTALSLSTLVGYAYFSWIPTVFVRIYGWGIPEIGYAFGLIVLIAGPSGVIICGSLGDLLYKNGKYDASVRIALAGSAITLPSAVGLPFAPNAEWALIIVGAAMFGGAMTSAAGVVAIVTVTPNQMRGQATAIYLFCISFLGLSIGATSVALITDYIFYDEKMLSWSLSIVCSSSSVCSVLLFWASLRPFYSATQNIEAKSYEQ